jgi:hypothetical protein
VIGHGSQKGTKHVSRIPDEALSTYIFIESLLLIRAEVKTHNIKVVDVEMSFGPVASKPHLSATLPGLHNLTRLLANAVGSETLLADGLEPLPICLSLARVDQPPFVHRFAEPAGSAYPPPLILQRAIRVAHLIVPTLCVASTLVLLVSLRGSVERVRVDGAAGGDMACRPFIGGRLAVCGPVPIALVDHPRPAALARRTAALLCRLRHAAALASCALPALARH